VLINCRTGRVVCDRCGRGHNFTDDAPLSKMLPDWRPVVIEGKAIHLCGRCVRAWREFWGESAAEQNLAQGAPSHAGCGSRL